MQNRTRWPATRSGQLKNLQALRRKKRMRLFILHARKLGQIRAYGHTIDIIKREIAKERKDLALIEHDIKQLN
jgi:hypothetical protein